MKIPVHRTVRTVRSILTLACLLAACSCVTLDEDERFELQENVIEARDEYHQKAEACRRIGGTIETRPLHEWGPYTDFDYKSAKCIVYR